MDTAPNTDPLARERIMAYATELPFLARCGYALSDCGPGHARGRVLVTDALAPGSMVVASRSSMP